MGFIGDLIAATFSRHQANGYLSPVVYAKKGGIIGIIFSRK